MIFNFPIDTLHGQCDANGMLCSLSASALPNTYLNILRVTVPIPSAQNQIKIYLDVFFFYVHQTKHTDHFRRRDIVVSIQHHFI